LSVNATQYFAGDCANAAATNAVARAKRKSFFICYTLFVNVTFER